jgi:hypothetical protein
MLLTRRPEVNMLHIAEKLNTSIFGEPLDDL